MSVSSKLAGIGVGAALALFAFATPSAAAESADLTTGTELAAASGVIGPITVRPFPLPPYGSGPIIVLPPKKAPIILPPPIYTVQCGFCAQAV